MIDIISIRSLTFSAAVSVLLTHENKNKKRDPRNAITAWLDNEDGDSKYMH